MFQNAVVTVDRAEGNGSVGTEWQETWVVPLDMTVRDMLLQIFGPEPEWLGPGKQHKAWLPNGRVTEYAPAPSRLKLTGVDDERA